MNYKFIFASTLAIISNSVSHAETIKNPSCTLNGFLSVSKYLTELPEIKPQYSLFLQTDSAIESQTKTIDTEEPILNLEIKILQRNPVLTSETTIKNKASWLLSPNIVFTANEEYSTLYKWASINGKTYDVVTFEYSKNKDLVIFIDEEGFLCDKVGTSNTDGTTVLLAGTYTSAPLAPLKKTTKEKTIGNAGLRIIYMGSTGGVMNFREIWVQHGMPVFKKDYNFDQFSKKISIAGFDFKITNAKSNSLTFSTDGWNLKEITSQEFSQLRSKVRLD